MKKIYMHVVFVFIVGSHLCMCGDQSLVLGALLDAKSSMQNVIQQEFDFSDVHFANYVYRRFYFINRLERTINLFFQVNKGIKARQADGINLKSMFSFPNTCSFKHPRINLSIDLMHKKGNLQPLFMIWDDFNAYKSVDDQLLVEEFTKEIFVISRNIFLSAHEESNEELLNFHRSFSLSPCGLLDVIDMYVDKILQKNPDCWAESSFNRSTDNYEGSVVKFSDLKPFVHIDDVMERFYIIHRLAKSMWQMELLHKKQYKYVSPKSIKKGLNLLIDDRILFTHKTIISCMRVMEQAESIAPLIDLLHEVKRYKFIKDDIFSRELLMLVFVLYKNLLAHESEPKDAVSKNVYDYFDRVYDTIDSIPLEEILDAVDVAAEELYPILEKYEFNSNMSWDQWFKKYAWLVPILTVKFIYDVFAKLNIVKEESSQQNGTSKKDDLMLNVRNRSKA